MTRSDETSSGLTARIDDPVVAININRQYPHARTAEDMLRVTSGIWRLNRERAGRARYAFAVYQGEIVEVYEVERWVPASEATLRYWRERERSQGHDFHTTHDGRSEFVGRAAPEAIRRKYVGKRLPVRHSQNRCWVVAVRSSRPLRSAGGCR